MVTQKPILMQIPGLGPIELVAYYEEFIDYYPGCEMQSKKWFVENVGKDWIVIDCGANIGYYSILFSRLAPEGHVYALEPTSTFEMLLANLQQNGVTNVTPLRLAVGRETGCIQDKIYRIWGKEPEFSAYEFIRIDDFINSYRIDHVDCIKIDVDSFDFEVLQGAEHTLIDQNPYVLVELNHALNLRGQSDIQALRWLSGLGYDQCVVLDNENFLFKRGADFPAQRGEFKRVVLWIAR